MEEKPDNAEEIKELQFRTVPAIRTDYYLKHMEVYREERRWVRLLNRFFLERSQADANNLPYVSLNERSFQIWGREKFLQREQGEENPFPLRSGAGAVAYLPDCGAFGLLFPYPASAADYTDPGE